MADKPNAKPGFLQRVLEVALCAVAKLKGMRTERFVAALQAVEYEAHHARRVHIGQNHRRKVVGRRRSRERLAKESRRINYAKARAR